MDKIYAAKEYDRFHVETFLPTVEKALTSGQLEDSLMEDLVEAVRISRAMGEASKYGKSMLAEVLFVILFKSLRGKKK